MRSILQELNFIKLQDFIKKELGVDCKYDNVYIFCRKAVPKFDVTRNLSVADLLNLTLDLAEDQNQIKNGYSSKAKKWCYTNTTRNIFRTAQWREIFETMGDECSIFILTKCTIVQETKNGLVLVCGHLRDVYKKSKERPKIFRESLFIGNYTPPSLEYKCFYDFVFYEINGYSDMKSHVSEKIIEVIENYNAISIQSMFKSFFKKYKDDYKEKEECFAPNISILNSGLLFPPSNTSAIEEDILASSGIENIEIVSKEENRAVKKYNLTELEKNCITEFQEINMSSEYKANGNEKTTDCYSHIPVSFSIPSSQLLSDDQDVGIGSSLACTNDKNEPTTSIVQVQSEIQLGLEYESTNDSRLDFSKTLVKTEFPKKDKREVPYDLIINFLFLISKKCLKPLFRYSDFKIFKGKLTLLIKRNVYEGISREELRKYFALPNLKLFKGKYSRQEHKIRCAVAERVLIHLMDVLFIKLVSYFFYSTICSNTRYKISYFKRSDWNIWTGSFYKNFLKTFEPTTRKKRMGTFRCIPKPDGFRVITNCSTSIPTGIVGQKELRVPGNERKLGSINSFLTPLLPMLYYESKGKLNNSLLNYTSAYRTFYKHLSDKESRQYLLKLDVSKCFDNLPHDRLLSLAQILLEQPVYYYSEYEILKENQTGDGFETKYLRRAGASVHPVDCFGCNRCFYSDGRCVEINDLENNGLSSFGFTKRCVIRERRHKRFEKNEILKMISDLIKNMVVCHQNRFYRFSKGIPQGCCISPILCSLYYGMMDEKYFKGVFGKGRMWRYIDDFLIITSSLDEIKEFIRRATVLKEYGLLFNWSKVETNMSRGVLQKIMRESGVELEREDEKALSFALGRDEKKEELFKSDSLKWCGLRIFDRGVGIKSVLGEEYFRYCVCLPLSKPGRRIFAKIKQAFYIKASPILINYRNRKLGENIYDIFYFIVRRLRILFLRADFWNQKYIYFILDWCIGEMKNIIRSRKILFDEIKVDSIIKNVLESLKLGIISKPSWN
ncbi:telomerase reverse transcriptase [Pancytospora epiphaga]|nr:telomerase reverse transcriptase [Pancytospora epiphaga]